MLPSDELLDHLYRQKVLAARAMTPEQRVLASFDLTAFVERGMADGIRNQFPEANEEEVRRKVCERIARLRQLSDRR